MIIAGAGIIGLSCAWRLSQKGHRVMVFDAGRAGGEASWAGAGMLAPGGEYEEGEVARMAVESLRRYPEFVRELEAESGLTIDFRQCGAIEAGDEDELARRASEQAALGIASDPFAYRGRTARFYPDDAIVDPRHVTKALATACRKRGVTLRENEAVTRVLGDGRGIETAGGILEDDGVLIAAGAWSSSLFPGLPKTMPVRGHLIAWKKQRGFLEPILRDRKTYLLQRASGWLIAGSTTEDAGFERSIDEEAVEDIRRRAIALLPELRDDPPDERWNGFRPGIEGNAPEIGRVKGTRVWTAFGHYRNGILLAPVTADRIAESFS
ncbi:MAG TPA: FAD-dependent oxidoreductase [Bryobacteraceae bacterium]|nr:FAD-dependent oxidoreductase [Bryobacteraceae bacterium]